MGRRERLAARLWPAIDEYVIACGGRPNRSNAPGVVIGVMLATRPRRIEISKRAIRLAIVDANGFVGAAAARLGVSRCTLMRRLRDAGLDEYARRWRHKTGWRFGRPRNRKCS